jgi:predicted HTH domain antitoxin
VGAGWKFQLRRRIAINLFDHYGIPLAEIARYTGVSTLVISKTLNQ